MALAMSIKESKGATPSTAKANAPQDAVRAQALNLPNPRQYSRAQPQQLFRV
jgi:signal transducing adaptor molecule